MDIVVIIVFVGALMGIGILISNAAGKNKKSEVIVAKPIETEAKDEDEDEDEDEDPSHVITPLLKAAKKSNIWICPNCEVENLNSSTRCRMCHCERN